MNSTIVAKNQSNLSGFVDSSSLVAESTSRLALPPTASIAAVHFLFLMALTPTTYEDY